MSSSQLANREDHEVQPGDVERIVALLEAGRGLLRELSTVLDRAMALCDARVVRANGPRILPHVPRPLVLGDDASLGDLIEGFEKEALQRALESTHGNRAKAARLLGTTERIFNYRVRKYGIDWKSYRG